MSIRRTLIANGTLEVAVQTTENVKDVVRRMVKDLTSLTKRDPGMHAAVGIKRAIEQIDQFTEYEVFVAAIAETEAVMQELEGL